MKSKIKATLQNKCLLHPGDHITLALSGGQDSVVLCQMLLSLKEEMGFTLSALHIHHGLRAASDEEEKWVQEYCKVRDLPLHVHHLDLSGHKGQSMEMAAREQRYRIFVDYTAEGRYVATAHHREDVMETFFINLCRGSGVKGLTSIPYRREGILRPMLDVGKEEILTYAEAQNLAWVEDESNADTYYLRNFIRHRILPELKSREDVSFNEGFTATLQNLREEAAFLEELAAPYGEEKRTEVLRRLPRPLLWRALKGRCEALTRERFEVIADRLSEPHFKEQIKGDLYCKVENGQLTFEKKRSAIPLTPLQERMELEEKTIVFQEIHSQFTHSDIDCDTIKSKLYLRSPQPGDLFCPRGRQKERTVKAWFQKLQLRDKERRLLITDGQHILFVEGLGVHRDFCATDTTKKALRIRIEKTDL